ncbi:unnamed protein product [Spirodela intermedia]|uniref:Uncharacterized protein n=1 Tax=Spirodela intermedia TaxID=51605 RepID=A0A7I8KYS3_SPIIN|nr:unnamed protein product [Spirodela intermedia]
MEEEKVTPQPVCAKEALDLLNCVADSAYDREKCLRLSDELRKCILDKKVKRFSLAEQSPPGAHTTSGGQAVRYFGLKSDFGQRGPFETQSSSERPCYTILLFSRSLLTRLCVCVCVRERERERESTKLAFWAR